MYPSKLTLENTTFNLDQSQTPPETPQKMETETKTIFSVDVHSPIESIEKKQITDLFGYPPPVELDRDTKFLIPNYKDQYRYDLHKETAQNAAKSKRTKLIQDNGIFSNIILDQGENTTNQLLTSQPSLEQQIFSVSQPEELLEQTSPRKRKDGKPDGRCTKKKHFSS